MKNISYTFALLALIIMFSPIPTHAMALNDVKVLFNLMKNGDPVAPKVLGASAVGSTSNIPPTEFTADQRHTIIKGLRYESGTPEIVKKPLKTGSEGDDVTRLQIFLGAKNILKVNPTGKYLGKTKEAVMKFQKEKNLKADGVVGPMVRDAIAKDVKAETPEIQ